MRRTALALCPLLLVAGAAVAATDVPARKSGLWEITNNMAGPYPMSQTMQQCVDEKTDKLTEQTGMREAQKNCSKNEVSKVGNKIVSESVCTIEGSVATTRAEFSGDFGSNYKGDIKTTYNPPMHGTKDMQMSITARFLGPCKAGQNPGDMIMPGGMKFNAADIQKQMQMR